MGFLSGIGKFILGILIDRLLGWLTGLWVKKQKAEATEKHIEETLPKIEEVVQETQKQIDAGPLTEAQKDEIRRKKAALNESLFNGGN